MGVGELIEQIRALYVDRLRDAVVAHSAVSVEPVVTDGAGIEIREGALKLPRRHDGMAANGVGVLESFAVESEGLLGFEEISFAWGDHLKVTLTPFSWDFAEFEVPTAGSKDLAGNLSDWFARWFTPSDSSADKLSGVLHALSDVRVEGLHSCFQVDFGSAPLACFEDLLDALTASRVESVVVREA